MQFRHSFTWLQACSLFFRWGTGNYLSEINTQSLSTVWTEQNGPPLCAPVSCQRRERNPTWTTHLHGPGAQTAEIPRRQETTVLRRWKRKLSKALERCRGRVSRPPPILLVLIRSNTLSHKRPIPARQSQPPAVLLANELAPVLHRQGNDAAFLQKGNSVRERRRSLPVLHAALLLQTTMFNQQKKRPRQPQFSDSPESHQIKTWTLKLIRINFTDTVS